MKHLVTHWRAGAVFAFTMIHIGHICCSYYFKSSSELEERFLHKLEWRLSEFEFGLFSKLVFSFQLTAEPSAGVRKKEHEHN